MSVNKVIYGGRTLIDLSSDTVTPDTLLKGVTAHKKDGTLITGILFENYPKEQAFYENIEDSNGNLIISSSGKYIEAKIVYRKA